MATSRSRSQPPHPEEPRDPYAGEGTLPPPDNVGEALARAREHGRAAASETVAALQALVEATSLATRGRNADTSRVLGPMSKLFEGLIDELGSGGGPGASRILESIALAVDDEIARWQVRAADDVEARTVLRAFLGLREVLWELGVRPGASRPRAKRSSDARGAASRPRPRPAGPRIQRVPVEG